jgi:hypothetical protein
MMVSAARAMVYDQGLPLFLWAETFCTAVYIQNKSPHSILGSKTPEEMYIGMRPDVSHLRIFGSVYCYRTICTCLKPKASRYKTSVTRGDLSLSP